MSIHKPTPNPSREPTVPPKPVHAPALPHQMPPAILTTGVGTRARFQPVELLALQRSAGNRFVQHLLRRHASTSSLLRPQKSGRKKIQRAIGFELETALDIEDNEELGYHEVVYRDNSKAWGRYFAITIEVVAGRQVLEFVLPHTDDLARQKEIYRRVELMRQAIKQVTDGGKKKARLSEVIGVYQALIQPSGENIPAPEYENRNDGISVDVTLAESDLAWKRMGVAPQATFGIALDAVPQFLERIMADPDLVQEKAFQSAIQEVVGTYGKQTIPSDVKGLIMLVETYLAAFQATKSMGALTYAKAGLPVMARTHFTSMYRSLRPDSRQHWMHYVSQKLNQYGDEEKYIPTIPQMFKTGTNAEGQAMGSQGPDARDWLQSIANPFKFISDRDRIQIASVLSSVLLTLLNDDKQQERVQKSISEMQEEPNAIPIFNRIVEEKYDEWIKIEDEEATAQEIAQIIGAEMALVDGLLTIFKFSQQHINAILDQAFVPLYRDLMSRPAHIGETSSSMGSHNATDEGSEKGLAVLELRSMQQQPATTPDAQEPWDVWLEKKTIKLATLIRLEDSTPSLAVLEGSPSEKQTQGKEKRQRTQDE